MGHRGNIGKMAATLPLGDDTVPYCSENFAICVCNVHTEQNYFPRCFLSLTISPLLWEIIQWLIRSAASKIKHWGLPRPRSGRMDYAEHWARSDGPMVPANAKYWSSIQTRATRWSWIPSTRQYCQLVSITNTASNAPTPEPRWPSATCPAVTGWLGVLGLPPRRMVNRGIHIWANLQAVQDIHCIVYLENMCSVWVRNFDHDSWSWSRLWSLLWSCL